MNEETDSIGVFYIYYNPERVDFSVSENELSNIEVAANCQWKDITIICISVGIPCFLNAVLATPTPFAMSASLFFNYTFGILGIVLSLFFGNAWLKGRKRLDAIFESIKNKPKMKIKDYEFISDVGQLRSSS